MQSFLDVSLPCPPISYAWPYDHGRGLRRRGGCRHIVLGALFGLAQTPRQRRPGLSGQSDRRCGRGNAGARAHSRLLLHAGRHRAQPRAADGRGAGADRVLRLHIGETLRGALLAIPLAQTDAASAIGLTLRKRSAMCWCRRQFARSRPISSIPRWKSSRRRRFCRRSASASCC